MIDIVSKIDNTELVLIENMTNNEALKLKSTCHITFDQIHLCYGNSGIEGMIFGQATIVGMDENVRKLVIDIIGYEPYVFATKDNLKSVILDLVNNKEMIDHYGKIGRKYVEDWHCDKIVTNKLINIYENLL